jgi:hypothetical protein
MKKIAKALPMGVVSLWIFGILNSSIAHTAEENNQISTEWISLEPATGMAINGSGVFGPFLSLANFRVWYFSWTLVEGGYMTDLDGALFYVGSHLGIPWHLGDRGQHKIQFSFGVGFGGMDLGDRGEDRASEIDGVGLFVSPKCRYTYHTESGFFVGVGVQALIWAAGNRGEESYSKYPLAVLLTVPIGWSF